MGLWIILPISLSLVSFIGTWAVYLLARSNNRVCSLFDWEGNNSCKGNQSTGSCFEPSISASSMGEGTFTFYSHTHRFFLSVWIAQICGVVAAVGSFVAGNANVCYLAVLHTIGAVLSFLCILIYTLLLTVLSWKCKLTNYTCVLWLLRTSLWFVQVLGNILMFIFHFMCKSHWFAVCEWITSVDMELFELSYIVEFYSFSFLMLSRERGTDRAGQRTDEAHEAVRMI